METKNKELKIIGRIITTQEGKAICIDEKYRPGMEKVDFFSHIIVLWWAGNYKEESERTQLTYYPYYAEDILTGVFACRSPIRPNPIGLTVCKIKNVNMNQGIIHIDEIDAAAGTEILDIKTYFPVYDRVKEFRQPDWLPDYWGEWRYPVPEQGE